MNSKPIALKPAKKLTAAQRTVHMPGVDMREQHGLEELKPAERVRRASWGTETHLVAIDGAILCGVPDGRLGVPAKHLPSHGKVCMACRVEASRRRAEVRG